MTCNARHQNEQSERVAMSGYGKEECKRCVAIAKCGAANVRLEVLRRRRVGPALIDTTTGD